MGCLHENHLPYHKVDFWLVISTIWCDRNGVKLHQYDRNESRRSVSMVGSHHPWIEPGRWSCRGVKGCCDGNLFQKFFVIFYPDLDLMEHGIYGVMAWVLGETGDWRIWPHIFKILMFDLWVECTVFDINLHNGKKHLDFLLGLGSKLHLQNSMSSLIPWKGKLLENWKIQWQSLDEAQPKPSI